MDIPADKMTHVEGDIKAAEAELDDDSESIITNERYLWIASIMKGCSKKAKEGALTTSDKIDKIVTNRWLALPIFALVMFIVYYVSISAVGTAATDWVNDNLFDEGFELFGVAVPSIPALAESGLDALDCDEWLKSLVVDGIIGGVGAVLGFLPQMHGVAASRLPVHGYPYDFLLGRAIRRGLFGIFGKSVIGRMVKRVRDGMKNNYRVEIIIKWKLHCY